MKILLVHLSDIHLKDRTDHVLSQVDAIAATATPRIHGAEAVFVVISGDIAFSGAREQYEIASGFLENLKTALAKEGDCPIYFILAPGNHDCDFSGEQSVRQALISTVLQKDGDNLSLAIMEECIKVQNNFMDFRDVWEPTDKLHADPLWVTYSFDIGGSKVLFDCLNVAWMSQLREEPGKLIFPIKRYEHLRSEPAHIRMLVMHHPLNWYGQASYRPFRTLVRSLGQIVITGHEHEQNIGENFDADSDKSAYVEGGVLQSHHHSEPPSFNLIEIDLAEQKYVCEMYSWTDGLFTRQEVAAWQDYRPLPAKRRSELVISEEFSELVDDPGGAFSHPGKQKITLSDIYIYPDLRCCRGHDPKLKDTVSSGVLRDYALLSQGVLLKGDERSGKTSLLYQLYRHFYDSGNVPLFLRGFELKPTQRDLRKAIGHAAETQYGKVGLARFEQTSATKKLVFVDDFDAPKLTNQQRAEIIKSLSSEFGAIVLAVSDLFEMDEVINEGSIRPLVGFREYELLEFGHKLRFDLIRKWTNLGDGSGRDSVDVFNAVDETEKSLNAILGRNLIPRVPIYLLTLLQTLELGLSTELHNSGHADCYRLLITGGLGRAGVKSIEMAEYLQFCTFLAWEYCRLDIKELDEAQLAAFNDWFSAQYHRRDLQRRIEVLIESKLLERRGEYYSFRYPYGYYFFLGKYLAENLQVVSIRKRIEHYCQHLYVRDYANTVLFLAHHTHDPFVYEGIAKVLHGLFSEKKAIEFWGDTQALSALVESAPELVFHGGDANENRREARELKDEMEGDGANSFEVEKEEESLSLVSKLTLLFKTVEILGQILKNQYATITNPEKERLLDETFSGPLRALRDFFDFIADDQDLLINEIERFIAENDSEVQEEKRKKLARDAVFQLITMISFGSIHKTALSVGSEHLRDSISKVAASNGTVGYRLIELSVKLECQSGIPYNLIGELKDQTKANVFGYQILQQLVLNYLYMFKTAEADKQKLCSELGISIRAQHAIELKTKDTKRLK